MTKDTTYFITRFFVPIQHLMPKLTQRMLIINTNIAETFLYSFEHYSLLTVTRLCNEGLRLRGFAVWTRYDYSSFEDTLEGGCVPPSETYG